MLAQSRHENDHKDSVVETITSSVGERPQKADSEPVQIRLDDSVRGGNNACYEQVQGRRED
jgi:hypothetical protein